MAKRTVLAASFCLFLGVNAGASMVSFYVIETGVPVNLRGNHHSVYWENVFMDVFFEAGHIVSNTPILRLESKPSGDILQQVNMQEVRSAGIDFLIIAQLDYNAEPVPSEMSFYIFRVTPTEKIYERKIDGRTARPAREELDYMKSIASGLITYVND